MNRVSVIYTIVAAIILLCIYYVATSKADELTITGAGSSFAAPLYSSWAQGFKEDGKGTVNYQSIGSGGGIKAIKAGTVDFGATDMPLSSKELQDNHLLQFPTAVGAVVPVVNLPVLKDFNLLLSRQMLVDIFSGKVTDWQELGFTKESLPIVVVHRSDGSGTTFLFTDYLSKASKDWTFGADKAIEWPVGLGAKGNEGVAATVLNTPGAIGYVEYAYAKTNKMSMVALENKSKQNVFPKPESFRAAVKSVKWGENYYTILTDTDDPDGWPIMGGTFILLDKNKPDVGLKVLKFIFYGFDNQQYAPKLNYIPLDTDTEVKVTKEIYNAFQKG